MELAGTSSEFAPAMAIGSPPSGDRSDIAAANCQAIDDVRHDELFDGGGEQFPGVEPVDLERLLLSSLATDGTDQR